MKQQKTGGYWFTCVFEDKEVVQKTIPPGETRAFAERKAQEWWRWVRAKRIVSELDPSATFKPSLTGCDDKLRQDVAKAGAIAKTLVPPRIELFQWEKPAKGSVHEND